MVLARKAADQRQGDQREDHDSGRPVSSDYLDRLGVYYHRCPTIAEVDEIARERSYKNRDEITVSPDKMGAVYEEKVKMFFNEHLHEDEEIRYILDGEGFFDVRSLANEWVRIRLEKDDLIVLPAGIFHRFTTDRKNVSGWMAHREHSGVDKIMQYIKAMRLFKDEPKWTPLNRAPDLDENPHRKKYLQDRSPEAGMMT